MASFTYAQIAADFDLWREHIDTSAAMTEEEFNAMTPACRVALMIETFGPEAEPAPTVDDLLESTAIGNGQHRWSAEGGAVTVDSDTLRRALEEAYDPGMPNWPATVELDA